VKAKAEVLGAGLIAAALGLCLVGTACSGGRDAAEAYAWVAVDESYAPRNSIEEFIKSDAAEKDLLPVYMRNYGKNASVLKKFRGATFAGANPTVLEMTFKGLEDWMLVDLRYKNEKERDVQRTVLYVEINNEWKVADSGRLMK
jgi:hypothetical protein